MANVLSELFQDIADAIRNKTGSSDKIVPNDFPTEILSIAAQEGGASGGIEGVAIASGSYSGYDGYAQTVTHNLGVQPDFVFVYPGLIMSNDSTAFESAFGLSKQFAEKVGYTGDMGINMTRGSTATLASTNKVGLSEKIMVYTAPMILHL